MDRNDAYQRNKNPQQWISFHVHNSEIVFYCWTGKLLSKSKRVMDVEQDDSILEVGSSWQPSWRVEGGCESRPAAEGFTTTNKQGDRSDSKGLALGNCSNLVTMFGCTDLNSFWTISRYWEFRIFFWIALLCSWFKCGRFEYPHRVLSSNLKFHFC